VTDDFFEVEIQSHAVVFNGRLFVSFQRTRQLAKQQSPQPPPRSLGALPVHGAAEYMGRVPNEWMVPVGVFLPIVPGEAFWLGLRGSAWKPNSVKVAIGGLDAISGAAWREGLHADPQDYVVCPPQLSLDGMYLGGQLARQFVSVAFESETQDKKKAPGAAMRIVVYDAKEGRFSETPGTRPVLTPDVLHSFGKIGVQPGSLVAQRILSDQHGVECWDQTKLVSLFVYWVYPDFYRAATGREPPAPASESEGYKGYRLP